MAGDASFSNVSVLLHCEAPNGSTAFNDTSTYAKNITQSGGAAISNAAAKFGSSSILNNTGSYVLVPGDASMNFGAGDFTVEFFAQFTSTAGDIYFFDKNGVSNGFRLELYQGNINFFVAGSASNIIQNAWAPATGQFYHIAFVRYNSVVALYINGVSQGSATYATAVDLSTSGIRFGNYGVAASWGLPGYLDEIRITSGICRYTAAFTPPTASFPDGIGQVSGTIKDDTGAAAARRLRVLRRFDGVKLVDMYSCAGDPNYSNNVLLLHAIGTNGAAIVDSSVLRQTVTVNGNAKISTAQGKFSKSSLSFDGVNSYLQIPSGPNFTFGAGDFTMEAWIYVTAFNGVQETIFGVCNSGGSTVIALSITDSTQKIGLTFYNGTTFYGPSSTGTIPLNTWTHVSGCRVGGNLYVSINGAVDSGTVTGSNIAMNSAFTIGRFGDYTTDDRYFNGYMSEIRVTKGVGLYSANFTPPTDRFADRASGNLGDYSFYTQTNDEVVVLVHDDDAGSVYNDQVIRVIPS